MALIVRALTANSLLSWLVSRVLIFPKRGRLTGMARDQLKDPRLSDPIRCSDSSEQVVLF